ncbi:MAG TPA: chloride channel protein [Solirubrobacteraceae bacterium]|nr:chloride channel protein [Solirubrobacteraceae bacterium]
MDARRWHSEQPNVTGRGIVAGYSTRFWLMVATLGVITGIGASALMELLHFVSHVAYGYEHGGFLQGVSHVAGWRYFAALGAASLILAGGVTVLGRLTSRGGGTDVSDGLWLRGARLDFLPSMGRALLSIITVGLGSSLGREGAPQTLGAAVATKFSDWSGLPNWQRRLLVACGAGAGFAAVYNVPLGGAVFAVEVLLGSLALPLVLPALATSVIATAIAWTFLGTRPSYSLPHYPLHPSQMVWALLAGPLIGVVAVGWVHLIRRAARSRPTGIARYLAPTVAFMALAALALVYPQLLGNGKGIVQLGAVGRLSLGLMVVLFVLKPLVTAACLGSGAPGGLFTPTLTIGVLLAGIFGTVWGHIWPGASLGSYAVIGGGAFLAAAMQGPLAGVVLVLELTRNFDSLMAPTLLAVTEATVVARKLGAPSIYSARLRPDPDQRPESALAREAISILDRPDGIPDEHGRPAAGRSRGASARAGREATVQSERDHVAGPVPPASEPPPGPAEEPVSDPAAATPPGGPAERRAGGPWKVRRAREGR